MKYTLVALAVFSATFSDAWMTTVLPTSTSHTRSSSSLEMASSHNDDGGSTEDSSLNRRNFFTSATSKVASMSLLVAASSTATYTPQVANAADDTTTYSKLYQPAPHSMDNKVVVITGGNAGLGLESSKRLAKAGATVIFTSRDNNKGKTALNEINEYLSDLKSNDDSFAGKVMMASLDLCDLSTVKSFQDRLVGIIGKDTKIDVLLNNAGVMAIPDKRLTADGYEKTFQTNHLGHFALTSTLLPMLSSDARIINVSSIGYQFGAPGLDLDNINGEKEYGPWSSYGESKLENILFTNELQKRIQRSSTYSNLKAFSLHPGAVATDLGRYIVGEEKFQDMKENGFASAKDKFLMESLAKFVKTVQEGASTQVYLAAANGVESNAGKFFSEGKVLSVKAFANDEAKAEELWSISEKLSGIKFDL